MNLKKLDPQSFAYDVPSQSVFPWQGVADTPFGAMWCLVGPGKTVKAHQHHEGETYIVARGRGTMTVDGASTSVQSGDVVYMEPFKLHELANASDTEELLFLAVWWEDMQLAAAAGEARAAAATATRPRRVLITATPPTPNGDLHVGHLSGPFLGADIYRRYLLMRGVEALYLCGADDHQSYVPLKGFRSGQTPRQVADHFADEIEETFRRARIEVDHFARPKTSAYHAAEVQGLFRALYDAGKLVAKDAPSLHCETCDKYLFEAHVSGKCPHCGAGSDGSACEQCGWPNDCTDLVDPVCKYCGGTPSVRTVRRLFFPLSQVGGQLREWYRSVRMNTHLRSLCLQMLENLPDIAVSHPSSWGIPVPVEGFEGQVIYVWLEMAPGFLAATSELRARRGEPAEWRDWWHAADQELVQFFGFDNGYFHAVLFPALWMAFDPDIRLARAFVTNEFLRLDGAKFSTSRGHAIWGKELLDRVPADAARFYLSYAGPEREQANFTLAEMEATLQRELVDGWQVWLRDLGDRIGDGFNGIAPWSGAWTADQEELFVTLKRLAAEVAAAYEAATFSPQRAARQLCELVRIARRFALAESHWARVPTGKEERRNAIALELAAARALALLAAPMMPDFAQRLWTALGAEGSPSTWEEVPLLPPGGRDVSALRTIEVLESVARPVAPPVAVVG
jgi:methionyl-tRNA synthetase